MTCPRATKGNGGQAMPQIGDHAFLITVYSTIQIILNTKKKGANHPEGVMTKSLARLDRHRAISWQRTGCAVTTGRLR